MNCVVYMDLRPFQCAQFLGGLKLLKLENFLLKSIPVLEGLKPLLPRSATSPLFTPPLFQNTWPCVQLLCAERNASCQRDLAIDKAEPPASAAK